MATDITSILKNYLAAMEKNEANVAELTRNLRGWVIENGEVVKEKIVSQIDESASRMGFVKVADLDNLLERISDLESRLPVGKTKATATKVKVKKSSEKAPVKNAKKTASGKKGS
jgi:hypothetical protein